MKERRRDIVKEAVQDVKSLKVAALAAAKNEIVEQMAPAVRRLLEQQLRGVMGKKNEDTDRLRRGIDDNYPGESHTGFEEAKDIGEDQSMAMDKMQKGDDKELDMEALNSFFPQLGEEPEMYGQADEAQIPTLEGEEGEEDMPASEPDGDECPDPSAHKPKAKKEAVKPPEGEGDMDEEVEISEEALRRVYEEALQTEVQVKKGFGAMTDMGELDAVAKDVGKGLNPAKAGEHDWDKEEPPAKEDFMKESIKRGIAENKMLRAKLSEAIKMIKTLGGKIHEVNLFNAKVLHVNRILNRTPRLTSEQRKVVVESMDKAHTINEVKTIYETIVGSFNASGRMTESRRPTKGNTQRVRTSGQPNQKVLSESVDRTDNDRMSARFKQLAGLVK